MPSLVDQLPWHSLRLLGDAGAVHPAVITVVITLLVAIIALVMVNLRNSRRALENTREVYKQTLKAQESATKAIEDRLAAFASTCRDLIWECDSALNFRYISPNCDQYLGVTSQQALSHGLCDFLTEHECDRVKDALQRASRSSEIDCCFILRFRRPDGTEMETEVSASPWFDEQGRLQGYRGICRSTTHRLARQQQQQKLLGQISRAERVESLGSMAGALAHSLNNILATIVGSADLIRRSVEPETTHFKRMQRIEEASRRATALTAQLLAYSGRGAFDIQQSDLRSLLVELKDSLQQRAGDQASLVFDLGSTLPSIEIDQRMIEHAIGYLIDDSRDNTGNEPLTYTLRTRMVLMTHDELAEHPWEYEMLPGAYVVLDISDDGRPIESDLLENLFEPVFPTLDGGASLRLAAVVGIMRGHAGTMRVASNLDGNTFSLYFPVCESLRRSESSRSEATPALPDSGV